MKSLLCLIFFALFAIATCKVVSVPTAQPPHKCAFSCTSTDDILCAGNGQCIQEFQGECMMSAYNCEHPHKPFVIIEDWKCKQYSAAKCTYKDLEQY